jgi:hypothetical protein
LVISLTVDSRESDSTLARVGVDVVATRGSVLTRIARTLVYVPLTMSATKSGHTFTFVLANAVNACASRVTRIWFTVVDVVLTVGAFVAFITIAHVGTLLVGTRRAIAARVG